MQITSGKGKQAGQIAVLSEGDAKLGTSGGSRHASGGVSIFTGTSLGDSTGSININTGATPTGIGGSMTVAVGASGSGAGGSVLVSAGAAQPGTNAGGALSIIGGKSGGDVSVASAATRLSNSGSLYLRPNSFAWLILAVALLSLFLRVSPASATACNTKRQLPGKSRFL